MKKYLKRTLAAIIAAAMVMSSTAAVYADDDLILQGDGSTVSVSSEIETDDATTDNNEDTAVENSSHAESTLTDSTITDSTVTEETEEIVPASGTSGTCGDNITWSYEDGTLTISGTGAMNNYIVTDIGFRPGG